MRLYWLAFFDFIATGFWFVISLRVRRSAALQRESAKVLGLLSLAAGIVKTMAALLALGDARSPAEILMLLAAINMVSAGVALLLVSRSTNGQ